MKIKKQEKIKSGGLRKMKNKLKDNLFIKIISISIAIIVWLYIQVVQSPVNDFYFYNIEVLDSDGNEIAADILKEKGLYIVDGENPTVDIHVRTSLLKLMNLKKDSYEARVDLTGAPNSQTYPVRIVKKGDNLNDIDISVRNAKQVAITFKKIVKIDDVPVKLNYKPEELMQEYYTDDKEIVLDKHYISIKAPESFEADKFRAEINIELTGKNESFSEDFNVNLLYDGKPVSLEDNCIEIIDKKVRADVNILYKKKIELKLSNKNEKIELELDPSAVVVVGDRETIKNMLDLTIREYNLEKEEVGFTQKIQIPKSDKYRALQDYVNIKIKAIHE